MSSVTLLVIAKEPLPGRAKTRLTPPCTPTQAAALAHASLQDTLDVVACTPAARRVLVFDGDGRRWRRGGFDLVSQHGHGLGERLAAAFADADPPALLVGMDTPQLTPALLVGASRALESPEVDAVLAPTLDGGYWSVGFKRHAPGAFERVTMSSHRTWREQRDRLGELGLRIHEPPVLRDVDTIHDARAVAGIAPDTRFARTFAALVHPSANPAGFDGVWTRLAGGDDPAVPPVRLRSSPPASHAQPLVNSPQDFRTCVLR